MRLKLIGQEGFDADAHHIMIDAERPGRGNGGKHIFGLCLVLSAPAERYVLQARERRLAMSVR